MPLTRDNCPIECHCEDHCVALDLVDDETAAGTWDRPENVEIDDTALYLVRTNGREWRDADTFVWHGVDVRKRLAVQFVRGRPEWIARVSEPE